MKRAEEVEVDIYETTRRALKEFIADIPGFVPEGLADALYAYSERGMWPDDLDSVSVEQAIMCWRIVEKVRRAGFPDALVM